jgi:ankyrin repeat protein
LWKANVSERTPLLSPDIAELEGDERIQAIQDKYVEALRAIDENVSSSDKKKNLEFLIMSGYDKLVSKMLNGTTPNFPRKKRREVALVAAAKANNMDLFRQLIDPDTRVVASDRYIVIQAIIKHGNLDFLRYYNTIQDISEIRNVIEFNLLESAATGNLELLKYLLDKIGILDLSQEERQNQLSRWAAPDAWVEYAVRGRNLDVVKYIVEELFKGKRFEHFDRLRNAFGIAFENGDIAIIKYLESLNVFNIADYIYVLNAAIRSKNIELVRYALSRTGLLSNIIKNRSIYEGPTEQWRHNPILHAIRYSTIDIVKYLLSLVAVEMTPLEAVGGDVPELLRTAIRSNNIDMLKFVLGAGVSVLAPRRQTPAPRLELGIDYHSHQDTMFETAASMKSNRMLNYLLDNIEYDHNALVTALVTAAKNGNISRINYLMKRVKYTRNDLARAMVSATIDLQLDTVRHLVSLGANTPQGLKDAKAQAKHNRDRKMTMYLNTVQAQE